MNKLEQLKAMTTVVADTGDIDAIAQYTPTDATTNPSLLLKAAQQAQYAHLLDDAIDHARSRSNAIEQMSRDMMDKLAVNFGAEILKIVPGRVSSEVDARYSFDTAATMAHADRLIALYQQGPDPDQDRVDLGGNRRRRAAGAPWHPLQPDADVQHRSGRSQRGGRRDADLAVRGTDNGLV